MLDSGNPSNFERTLPNYVVLHRARERENNEMCGGDPNVNFIFSELFIPCQIEAFALTSSCLVSLVVNIFNYAPYKQISIPHENVDKSNRKSLFVIIRK